MEVKLSALHEEEEMLIEDLQAKTELSLSLLKKLRRENQSLTNNNYLLFNMYLSK
jgi:hypothetical protein